MLNALEVVNREAIIKGFGSGAESRADNILSGIHQIRTANTLHGSSLASEDKFRETPIIGGSRQVSKLKAELVRNNIVTRANLMKLYQPPKVIKMPTPL